MAQEEFLESDVVWPEAEQITRNGFLFRHAVDSDTDSDLLRDCSCPRNTKVVGRRRKSQVASMKTAPNSAPVNIPANGYRHFGDSDEYEDENSDDGQIVPPHVILSRRLSGRKMAFSVCALKGRDLRRVRNSVLRMTGFLET